MFPKRYLRALYPLTYLVTTMSMTAFLVLTGLLKKTEITADIAIAQAATLATFYAFSGNTRSLILNSAAANVVTTVLNFRCVLVFPLAVASFLLCTHIGQVPAIFALALILRRCIEWFSELQLTEAELKSDFQFTRAYLAFQSALLGGLSAVVVYKPEHLNLAAYVWAVLPILPTMGLFRRHSPRLHAFIKREQFALVPHLGSTITVGLTVYLTRLLFVVLVGKGIAGHLFTAISIGSLVGSAYANVFGPSVHRGMAPVSWRSKPFALALGLLTTLGLSVIGAVTLFPAAIQHWGMPTYFYITLGLSLIGGAAMVIAQTKRLQAIAIGTGRHIFALDLLVSALLIFAIPFLFYVSGPYGLGATYLANAGFIYVLYWISGERLNGSSWLKGIDAKPFTLAILAFCIFAPIFFQLSGHIYNSRIAMVDSGGVLAELPIPISVLACFIGIAWLGHHGRAYLSFLFTLALLILMTLSVVIAGGSAGETIERRKLLLMMQVLLPVFALPLGQMFASSGSVRRQGESPVLQQALLAVIALLVPAQLISTWLISNDHLTLSHYLYFFSVYQHVQYVPVIVACCYLLCLVSLWSERQSRPLLCVLSALIAAYIAASFSMLALFVYIAGIGALAIWRYKNRDRLFVVIAAFSLCVAAGYTYLTRTTITFSEKYVAGFVKSETPSAVGRAGAQRAAIHDDARTALNKQVDDTAITRPIDGSTLYFTADPKRSVLDFHALVADLSTGDEVELRSTGALPIGFVTSRRYFVIRNMEAGSVIRLAASHDNALKGIAIPIVDAGSGTLSLVQLTSHKTSDSGIPLPKNLTQRLSNWSVYLKEIGTTPTVFVFGNAQPVDRFLSSSALNYYLDLVANFGLLSVLPFIGLIVYTIWLIRSCWRSKEPFLICLTGVVAFLVLIDANLKVTLRQPYPGIVTFFLWGVLISMLQQRQAADRPSITLSRSPIGD